MPAAAGGQASVAGLRLDGPFLQVHPRSGLLTVPATLSLTSAALGAGVGALALRASRGRGWTEIRWFAVIAFTAAAYAIANLATTLGLPGGVAVVLSRLQTAAGMLHFLGWLRYAEAFGEVAPRRAARWLEGVLLAVAALALVPGVVFGGQLVIRPFTPWHVVYTDAVVSPAGYVLLAVTSPAVPVVLARLVSAARRGVQQAWLQAGAFAFVVALALNDCLAASGRLDLPYLLDAAFLAPLSVVAWATGRRVVEASRDLDDLRGRLESLVGARTQALTVAQEALVRAERLAALGQMANGVAHQVSNPAAVVTANLRYLAEGLGRDSEAGEVVADALSSMQQINELVRRLADAGRMASAPRSPESAGLDELVGRVVGGA